MPVSDPWNVTMKKATREGYGEALAKLGGEVEKLVVLDADLSGSTKTNLFQKQFPDRHFNFGVAEQNMIGHAAGLAMSGLIPVASSFAMFATGRAWEIVRNSVAYPGLNVKIAATHAGITLGEDGASHQIIEDIAIMRTIPEMTVLVPADYNQAKAAIRAAVEYEGPVYVRLGRPGIPVIYDENDDFEIGKADIVKEGSDVAFFATGIMTAEAWKAAIRLEEKTGKKIKVVNFGTIKPIDSEIILRTAQQVKQIITFEEHNVQAGFGSAVREVLGDASTPVSSVGIENKFGQSGTIGDLMDHYGLSAERLIERLLPLLSE